MISSLAHAVKELIENALDAGAKNIVVWTREFGTKLIEVEDNGAGIREKSFPLLCRKYYSSKLHNAAELDGIRTFGFRGEALFTLCALSKLSVTTKHVSEEIGHVLNFDGEGELFKSDRFTRNTGTTVILENFLVSPPDGARQCSATSKEAFTQMVNFIYSYCLINREAALSLVEIDKSGKRLQILEKQSPTSYKHSIIQVFGYKEALKLVPYAQIAVPEDIEREFGLRNDSKKHFEAVRIEGFVSNCEHGSGRDSADQQFFFVNSRPCELPKVQNLINDVYRSYNNWQYPFVMLNIVIPDHLVIVNLSPDKRTVVLQRNNVILAVLKVSLTTMYQKQVELSVKSEGAPNSSRCDRSFAKSIVSTGNAQNPREKPPTLLDSGCTRSGGKKPRYSSPSNLVNVIQQESVERSGSEKLQGGEGTAKAGGDRSGRELMSHVECLDQQIAEENDGVTEAESYIRVLETTLYSVERALEHNRLSIEDARKDVSEAESLFGGAKESKNFYEALSFGRMIARRMERVNSALKAALRSTRIH